MREAFVNELMELAREDGTLYLVTGDLGFGVLRPFWEAYPDRFINAGIAEQAMTGLAAGLALEGNTVYTYSLAGFPTLRCIEQIRNDAAYHRARVRVVSVGGGFTYGALGMSHHATEDIAIVRALPGMLVATPADAAEARAVVRAMHAAEGSSYLRIERSDEPGIQYPDLSAYKLGDAVVRRAGDEIYLFTVGSVLYEALNAADALAAAGHNVGVISFPTVKPIDERMITSVAARAKHVFTVEEHNVIGGLGGAVAEVLGGMDGPRAKLHRVGLNDEYSGIVGSQAYLRKRYGFSADALYKRVLAGV